MGGLFTSGRTKSIDHQRQPADDGRIDRPQPPTRTFRDHSQVRHLYADPARNSSAGP